MLPVTLAAAALAASGVTSAAWRWSIVSAGVAGSACVGWQYARRALDALATISDLLSSLREGDYGLRGRVRSGRSPLQMLISDVNELSDVLRKNRLSRTETARFVAKTLVALENPVIVVDASGAVRIINPAARRLIGAERLTVVGLAPADIGFGEAMDAPDGSVLSHRFPRAGGRWVVRRASWHSDGREQTLVMLHDMSAVLGAEEQRAWQRLVRVLSHELNNSLAPIGSLADTLSSMLARNALAMPREELREGLEAIARRSASLARFVAGYGRLASLPAPVMTAFRLDVLLERLATFERRVSVTMACASPVTIAGDEDQLGQAFMNLLRNAVESAAVTGGGVSLRWFLDENDVVVLIADEGVGLPVTDSLFVPFYTTKPNGSGIGLNLSRLIAEAHGGTVSLESRDDGPGALATVRLPRRVPRRVAVPSWTPVSASGHVDRPRSDTGLEM